MTDRPTNAPRELEDVLTASGLRPRHAAHVAAAVREWLTSEAVPLIRRAINDPGSFVDRGPGYDGESHGERLDRWQDRAIAEAVALAAAAGVV